MLQQKTHFEQVPLEIVTAIVETETERQKASEQFREAMKKKSARHLLGAGTAWEQVRPISEVKNRD